MRNNVAGIATAYAVLTAFWIRMPCVGNGVRGIFGHMSAVAKPSLRGWWQLPYVSAAIAAAYYWQHAADDLGLAPGVDHASAFGGGFLMLLGSRVAGGCTGGHGISGGAILMVGSFVAIVAMFGAGTAVGVGAGL